MDTHRVERELAERYTAAWNSREPHQVADCYSPNGWLQVNGGAPAVGRSAVAEFARGFMTSFPDMSVTMDEFLVRDEEVTYHWTLRATNTGPGGTGKHVHVSGVDRWRVWNGMIAESHAVFDQAVYERQLHDGAD